jgi:hypothetical protein
MITRLGATRPVIARSEATRQASAAREASGLLRFARNDGAKDANTKKGGPEPAFYFAEKAIRE